jgi:hypothetical protein
MTDFNFIGDESMRKMVSNGYKAIDELELWQWMNMYTPDDNSGFIWSNHPNMNRIIQKMESLADAPGHSGASFAVTMRQLEYIAKNGLDKYKVFIATA